MEWRGYRACCDAVNLPRNAQGEARQANGATVARRPVDFGDFLGFAILVDVDFFAVHEDGKTESFHQGSKTIFIKLQ